MNDNTGRGAFTVCGMCLKSQYRVVLMMHVLSNNELTRVRTCRHTNHSAVMSLLCHLWCHHSGSIVHPLCCLLCVHFVLYCASMVLCVHVCPLGLEHTPVQRWRPFLRLLSVHLSSGPDTALQPCPKSPQPSNASRWSAQTHTHHMNGNHPQSGPVLELPPHVTHRLAGVWWTEAGRSLQQFWFLELH